TGRRAAASVTVFMALAALIASTARVAAQEPARFIPVGVVTTAPIGWTEFCIEYAPECDTTPSVPYDVALSSRAFNELKHINVAVNTRVKPMTDMEHWGVVERWNYPDDGYGDCEDYALEKRKLLMQAGWPRSAFDDGRARPAWRRPCCAHRQNRSRRADPRQSDQP